MIFTTLKMLHLLALAFGSVSSLGNVYLMLSKGPHDLDAPGFTNMLRKLYRLTALGAIVTLWVTGLLMKFMRYGWVPGLAFHAKIALALLLLAIIVFVNLMAPGWARRGGPPAWVANVHVIAAASFLATVILAVLVFK
ncbi:MAG: hypothetical protein KDJ66_01920 [Nitratireductor sp.]|nr:hypothetical protein [Nitratireductor sp.]